MPIKTRTDSPSRITFSATHSLIFAGLWSGPIQAINWRTGKQRWRQTGMRELCGLCCLGTSQLLALQYKNSDRCVAFDQQTGEHLAQITGVDSMVADPVESRLVLLRDVMEYRTDLSSKPIFKVDTRAETLYAGCFGPSFFVVSSSLVRCFDCENRDERWQHDPGQLMFMTQMAYLPHCGQVFGERRESPSSGYAIGVFFDADSGEILNEVPLPGWEGAIVDNGRFLVYAHGMLELPSLKWIPRKFVMHV